jgi:hypothetical protein
MGVLALAIALALFFFPLPDLFEVMQRPRPLIIQEGRDRAGQSVQPRRDGPNSDLDSS